MAYTSDIEGAIYLDLQPWKAISSLIPYLLCTDIIWGGGRIYKIVHRSQILLELMLSNRWAIFLHAQLQYRAALNSS